MSPEMQNFVSLASDNVKKNVTVVNAGELGQSFMLRISMDKMPPKGYAPRISQRQAPSEDRTVPRITCAPTLLGCFIGYVTAAQDFINYEPGKHRLYKQGYYLYQLDFEEALRPNSKLVYDQKFSDEHWLVPYSEETRYYTGRLIGKLFISEIAYEGLNEAAPKIEATLYLELTKEDGIRFSKNLELKKGYYRIKGPANYNRQAWDKDSKFKIDEIDKTTFEQEKSVRAGLLSYEEPSYAKW